MEPQLNALFGGWRDDCRHQASKRMSIQMSTSLDRARPQSPDANRTSRTANHPTGVVRPGRMEGQDHDIVTTCDVLVARNNSLGEISYLTRPQIQQKDDCANVSWGSMIIFSHNLRGHDLYEQPLQINALGMILYCEKLSDSIPCGIRYEVQCISETRACFSSSSIFAFYYPPTIPKR